MRWKRFCQEAGKINKRFFFKKVSDGYEVWEKGYQAGPGFPKKYRVMVIPKLTPSYNWRMRIDKLKRMTWERKREQQVQKLKDMLEHNKAVEDDQMKDMLRDARAFFRENRKFFASVASDEGMRSLHFSNKYSGMSPEDAKKQIYKMYEKTGA